MMPTITRRKFTLQEYHKLGEIGFFQENEQVELIRGEIILMPLKKTPHSACNTRLGKQLYQLIGNQATIRIQEPVILPNDSEPQPDAAIVVNKEVVSRRVHAGCESRGGTADRGRQRRRVRPARSDAQARIRGFVWRDRRFTAFVSCGK